MNPAAPFLVVGGLELLLALLLPAWLGWLPAWAGVGTSWVGIAYAAGRPGWLGKQHAPTLSWWALMPYHLVARGAVVVSRKWLKEERVEISPGLWVGGWPRRGAPGLAQLDLTAELPRRGDAARYACVPMLDGAPFSPEDWRAAVAQARAWRAEGLPVLIHCAYGHGRSVAVLIGVMVEEGLAPGWEEAHARVLAVRPLARMTPAQRALVASLTAPPAASRETG